MAVTVPIVTCPECEKKFKPKSDVSGKKIKCPFCKEPFVVPEAKEKAPATKPKAVAAKADLDAKATEPAEPAADPDLDADPNPYGVKNVEMVPRCPNCTEEMGPHDIICLGCGYNTVTRQWGKTEKIVGLTFGRHLMYLLPAIGAAVFTVFAIIGMLLLATWVPSLVQDNFMFIVDSEAIRMWSSLIVLGWIWGAGMYCFKKFIDQPKPDEIALD